MALSPEIQAAIEKGLEQITDLNALQDALKTLDPWTASNTARRRYF